MSTFTLAILFDHFQFALIHGPNIPGSYAILLLKHCSLLPIPITSTTGCCFCFGSIPSFFLELFPYWAPVANWAPTDLGSSSFSVLSFCLLILFMGFSRQEYWSGLPFPSPVEHILSDLSTMTHVLNLMETHICTFEKVPKASHSPCKISIYNSWIEVTVHCPQNLTKIINICAMLDHFSHLFISFGIYTL